MKNLILLLVALSLVAARGADYYVTATITVTNASGVATNGTDTLTVNGDTRTATNNVASNPGAFWRGTNSQNIAATNLYNHIALYPFGAGVTRVFLQAAATNAIYLHGQINQSMSAAAAGTWGTVLLSTNYTTNTTVVAVPANSFTLALQTNIGNGLVDFLSVASTPAASTVQALANYTALYTWQTLSNKVFQASTNRGGAIENAQKISGTNVALTNVTIYLLVVGGGTYSGAISNLTNGTLLGTVLDGVRITNALAITGNLGNVSNGTLYATVVDGSRLTNVTAITGTMSTVSNGAWWNPTLYNANVSNLNVTGGAITGSVVSLSSDSTLSLLIMRSTGSSAFVSPGILSYREKGLSNGPTAGTLLFTLVASGLGGTNDRPAASIRMLADGTFSDTNAPAYMVFSTTPTGAVQVVERLRIAANGDVGVSNQLTVAGVLQSGSITNSTITGTNNWNGDMALQSRTFSSLGNGDNTGILLGTNVVIELSGGTTIARISSFLVEREGSYHKIRLSGAVTNTVSNESLAESTDATRRITTGTGGDITLTNQPAWIEVIRRGTRWELMNWSR